MPVRTILKVFWKQVSWKNWKKLLHLDKAKIMSNFNRITYAYQYQYQINQIFNYAACLEYFLDYRISSSKRRTSNKRRTFGCSYWNKRLLSDKRRNSKCGAYENSQYILLVAKPKCIWNSWYLHFFQYISVY